MALALAVSVSYATDPGVFCTLPPSWGRELGLTEPEPRRRKHSLALQEGALIRVSADAKDL